MQRTLELLSQRECAQRIGREPLSYPVELVKLAWAYDDEWSKQAFLSAETWAAGDKFWDAFVSYRRGGGSIT
jgi:hypothetical protein